MVNNNVNLNNIQLSMFPQLFPSNMDNPMNMNVNNMNVNNMNNNGGLNHNLYVELERDLFSAVLPDQFGNNTNNNNNINNNYDHQDDSSPSPPTFMGEPTTTIVSYSSPYYPPSLNSEPYPLVKKEDTNQREPSPPILMSESGKEIDVRKIAKTIQALEQQVNELKMELASSMPQRMLLETRPKSIVTAIWSMPDGFLKECSANLHEFFKVKPKVALTIDHITPAELVEERRLIRRHYARDKPEMRGVSAVKAYVRGDGERMVVRSILSLLHFEDGSYLQVTYWV